MYTVTRKILLVIVSISLVVGCQSTSTKVPTPAPQVQVELLSSLLAATLYLKNNCNRTDIPDTRYLYNTALNLAKKRGWKTTHNEYQKINSYTDELYQALANDETPLEQQCREFNQSVASFIEQARVLQNGYQPKKK